MGTLENYLTTAGEKGITIYFPQSWDWYQIYAYFNSHPEMEALEPDIRVATNLVPHLQDHQWGAV